MKQKVCSRCEKPKRIWARGLCKSCDIIINPQKYMIEKKVVTKKKKPKTITKLKKELDDVFSKYIRHFYSLDGENVECYTCGVVKPIKEMQNAHFWSRSHLSTRWEEENCRVGCVSCNIYKSGNYIVYTRKMLLELGEEKFKELEDLKNSTFKLTKSWLEEKIEYYSSKVK